jgi:hypothetical protein
MRAIPADVVIFKVPPRHSPPAKVETLVDQVISTAVDVHIETPPPSVENVTDLLADSAPAMDAVPLQPSTPTNAVVDLEASESSENIVTSRPSQEDAQEPSTTTIRLVGGGGSSGIVDTNLADNAVSDPAANVMSVASSAPGGSPPKKEKIHEKSKSSLSSLKKIANIGEGKRKKDSSSSIKETI